MDRQQATIVRFSPEEIRGSPEELVHHLAGSMYKGDFERHDLVAATIEQAGQVISPVLIFGLHKVTPLDNRGTLTLENGLCLRVPQAERDPFTRYLASCVCSLGAALENTCRRLTRRGQLVRATLLDAAGVSLLDALVNKSYDRLCQCAREMGLFAGCPFGPGYGDMPMEAQSLLFQLVDASAIQVRLNETLVMHPMKSLSFFVRLSARENPDGPISKCRRCAMKHCQFRREHTSYRQTVRSTHGFDPL